MKHMVKRTITSVKIPENLYEDFKIMSVRSKINLQEIVERTIFMLPILTLDKRFTKDIVRITLDLISSTQSNK